MAFDGFFIHRLIEELNTELSGARIDKIHMPEKDEILLHLRMPQGNKKLLLSCNPSYPRLHLTNEPKKNPISPPMFCMLLRKHLGNSKILSVTQPGNERIAKIHFECRTELGLMKKETLVLEIMGKHSNIILIDDSTNQIIDSLKRVNAEMSSIRQILPNLDYILPPNQSKFDPFSLTFDALSSELSGKSGALEEELLLLVEGFSKNTIREWIKLSALDASAYSNTLKAIEVERLYLVLQQLIQQPTCPTKYFSSQNEPVDLVPFEFHLYQIHQREEFSSLNELVDQYYSHKDRADRLKSYSSDLTKLLNTHLKRNRNKLKKLNAELKQSEEKEIYKIYGDLILANLHCKSHEKKHLSCVNYFEENLPQIEIPLNPLLSLIENATAYFKRYNKLKVAYELIKQQLEETNTEIFYLENILVHISNATELEIIDEIRGELFSQGYLKKKRNQIPKKQKKANPMEFISSNQFKILVGRNNLQNEHLTLKIAHKNDIWFHVKDHGGSHVILINPDGLKLDEIPDKTIEESASLAAYYSQDRNSTKVSVDYTYRKNVKKHPCNKPGMVNYESYYTINIEPKSHI